MLLLLAFFALNDITFCNVFKLFTAARMWMFSSYPQLTNKDQFIRPMSDHLVWQLLKAWSWRTVKLNTILQCNLYPLTVTRFPPSKSVQKSMNTSTIFDNMILVNRCVLIFHIDCFYKHWLHQTQSFLDEFCFKKRQKLCFKL